MGHYLPRRVSALSPYGDMLLVVRRQHLNDWGCKMPKGWRPCPKPYCPEPTPPTQRYCDAHMVEYEQSRGTKTERGYGKDYQQLRIKWAKRIATGIVNCKRCRKWINPNEPWHLDHDDNDRNNLALAAPSHALCNLSAGGKASNRDDGRGLPPTPPPF